MAGMSGKKKDKIFKIRYATAISSYTNDASSTLHKATPIKKERV